MKHALGIVLGAVIALLLAAQLFECLVHDRCETRSIAGDPPPD